MIVELENKIAALLKENERLQSYLNEEMEKRREYAAEKNFLYDFLSTIYGHGSLDVATLQGMMQSFDVTLDEIADYTEELGEGLERHNINNYYYAMFQVALNKAVDDACFSLDVEDFEYDFELDYDNIEIFTNYLDSHLCIKVGDDWAEVYDKDELLARVQLLVEQWKNDNQDDE